MLQLNHDYSLAEAAELAGKRVDDLIYAAADGRLQIYVRANRWAASCVYQISSAQSPGGSFRVERSPVCSRSTGVNDAETVDHLDITTGRKTIFGRQGPTKSVYQLERDGLNPVASHCFREYHRDPENAQIEIDLNKALHTPNKDVILYFCPDPPLLVSEALQQGKLAVMGSDLNEMLGQDNAGQQLADLCDDPRWPDELGIAIQAWQTVSRSIKDGEKPGVKLRDWLKEKYGHLSEEAIKRIATVANWDKSPGAPKK